MEPRRMAVGGGFYRFCRMVSTINRLIRWAVTLLMVAALCFAFYEVGEASGRKEAKIRIIEKEVYQCKIKINTRRGNRIPLHLKFGA